MAMAFYKVRQPLHRGRHPLKYKEKARWTGWALLSMMFKVWHDQWLQKTQHNTDLQKATPSSILAVELRISTQKAEETDITQSGKCLGKHEDLRWIPNIHIKSHTLWQCLLHCPRAWPKAVTQQLLDSPAQLEHTHMHCAAHMDYRQPTFPKSQ